MHVKHVQYTENEDELLKIRDAVGGEHKVKNSVNSLIYLPHPSDTDTTSEGAITRYNRFKARAEFDEVAGATLISLGGAMWQTPAITDDLPSEIEYLMYNSDGANTTLSESMRATAYQVMQMGSHFLLADYDGAQAYIRHYPRESVFDWDYEMINGIKQLSYAKLIEHTSHVNKQTLARESRSTALILGLDENGHYYQQQITIDSDGIEQRSEMVYPEYKGAPMMHIPHYIVTDRPYCSSEMPLNYGVIHPIVLKTISRYQVNADLKEVLHRDAQPTPVTTGWDSDDMIDAYKKMNGGTMAIKLGSSGGINLPAGVTASYLENKADNSYYFKYLEANQKEIKAFGGSFDTSEATEEAVGTTKIKSAEQLRALVNIANSIEEGYKMLIDICFGFMSTSNKEPEYELVINKEFNQSKLDPEERKAIANDVTTTLISKQEGLRQMRDGGILKEEVDVILAELEM